MSVPLENIVRVLQATDRVLLGEFTLDLKKQFRGARVQCYKKGDFSLDNGNISLNICANSFGWNPIASCIIPISEVTGDNEQLIWLGFDFLNVNLTTRKYYLSMDIDYTMDENNYIAACLDINTPIYSDVKRILEENPFKIELYINDK